MCANSKQICNFVHPKHAPHNCVILVELWYDLDESDSDDNYDENNTDNNDDDDGFDDKDDGFEDEDDDERNVMLPIAYIHPNSYAGYDGVPDETP